MLRRFLIASLLAPAMATQCYDNNGLVSEHFVPCHPGAAISVCCSSVDYCLSNGLCLDAGADNYYTQQGCTNRNWETPCRLYCETDNSDGSDYGVYTRSRMWLCPGTGQDYCCGNSTCCEDSANLHNVGFFTSAFNPPGAASSTASSPTTLSTAASVVTTTMTTTTTFTSLCTETPDNAKNVKLGVGVGVPVGLACAAAALAAGYFLGRRTAGAPSRNGGGEEHATQDQQYYNPVPNPKYEIDTRPEPVFNNPPAHDNNYLPQELAGNSPAR